MKPPTSRTSESEEFVTLITEFQPRLHGYILSQLAAPDAAQDVLQETNIVLWKKADTFTLGSNFKAWSFRIAHFQIMAYRQRQVRSKVLFDDELVRELAQEMEAHDDETFLRRQKALDKCLDKLNIRQRDLIVQRYFKEISIADLSKQLKMATNALSQILFRARQNLIACVQKEV